MTIFNGNFACKKCIDLDLNGQNGLKYELKKS